MVCHSREFVMAILQEKPYFQRLSSYLIDQLLELSCDDFARFRRALDAVESGSPVTRFPGEFSLSGVLAGYGHIHYRRSDWAAGNLALLHKMAPDQPIEQTIDKLAQQVVDGGGDFQAEIGSIVDGFAKRVSSKATGDWVLFRATTGDRQYLAIHEHTERGSAKERELRTLLDSL